MPVPLPEVSVRLDVRRRRTVEPVLALRALWGPFARDVLGRLVDLPCSDDQVEGDARHIGLEGSAGRPHSGIRSPMDLMPKPHGCTKAFESAIAGPDDLKSASRLGRDTADPLRDRDDVGRVAAFRDCGGRQHCYSCRALLPRAASASELTTMAPRNSRYRCALRFWITTRNQ